MRDTKVTIITVAYNCAETIATAIESVLNQTYQNIEYLVIDGKSKDDTAEIARKYVPQFVEKGMSMKVVSEPDNGMYDALNKGISMASGELIGNINADDWYEPIAVEKMVELYKKENYDLAWADLRIIKPSGNMIKKARVGKLWTTAGFCHPTMFSKREVLLEIPYACKQMDDDFEMVLRANKAGKKIVTLNEVLANYRFGGMSTKKSIKDSFKRVKLKYTTYRNHGYSPIYWFYCVAIEAAKYILG
mgnify:CR=1 FL=1